jgi:hypothetical protein
MALINSNASGYTIVDPANIETQTLSGNMATIGGLVKSYLATLTPGSNVFSIQYLMQHKTTDCIAIVCSES